MKKQISIFQNEEKELLDYGVNVFLKNKEVDAITVEGRNCRIFLRRREEPRSNVSAIGFMVNSNEDDDYYEEDKKQVGFKK